MYGTCARMRVKPENREKLQAIFEGEGRREVPGFITTYVLTENGSDVVWLVAVFEDKATYDKNAADPAQHQEYLQYRALLEEEPEWHHGVTQQFS